MNSKSAMAIIKNNLPFLIMIIVFALLPAFSSSRFWINIFIVVFVRTVSSVSLRTLGLSGSMSMGHSAFVGIGAYTAAVLATHYGWPPYSTILVGAIAAMIIGVITGLPFVRLRSIYYLMATMFLGVAIVYFISALKITGGAPGLAGIPTLFKSSEMIQFYYFFFIIAVVSIAAMYRFEFSRIGTILKAISQSEYAASAMGVNTAFYKLLAVGCGCFFAGLAGAAFSLYNSAIVPSSYGMLASVTLLMYNLIGGHQKFIGPILGTIILVIIPEASRAINEYAPFVTVIVMLLVAYLLPGGLASIPEAIKITIDKRRKRLGETIINGSGEE